MRDNPIIIAELRRKEVEIISWIKVLKGHIKNLNAVIEMFTMLSPKEIALNAINENPEKIWTAREIVSELRNAHEIRKLDRTINNPMQESAYVLCRLCNQGTLERVGRGQYRKIKKEKTTAWEANVAPAHNDSNKHERYRQSQKAKGLCTKCSRPATSKTLCDYHRGKKRESNQQQGRIK